MVEVRKISEDPYNHEQYYKQGFVLSADELGFDTSSNPVLVQEIINGVIDWVFQYTGLDTQYEKREEYDGTGNERLLLSSFPVQQLLDVQISTGFNSWTDVTRYIRCLEHGELIVENSIYQYSHFPVGVRNIRVRYIAGLKKIPPMIRMTIVELCQVLFVKQGILGALDIGNPLTTVTDTSTGGGGTTTTTTATSDSAIKSVSIKSLKVVFANTTTSVSSSLQAVDVRKVAITKILETILMKDNVFLKRLDMISQIYCL